MTQGGSVMGEKKRHTKEERVEILKLEEQILRDSRRNTREKERRTQ